MEDNTKIFGEAEGLVETKVHGLRLDAYIVTEDKMKSFNSYSSDFQLWITIGSVFFGGFISTLLASSKCTWIFWVCLAISALSAIFIMKSYRRFKNIKGTMFVKMSETEPNLRIITAKYGTENKEIDITDKLKEKIKNNSISIKIDNSIAGDPLPGKSKKAIIEYFIYGEEKKITLKEGEILKLP